MKIKRTNKEAVAKADKKKDKKKAKPASNSSKSLKNFTGGARPKSKGKLGIPAELGIEGAWCHAFYNNAKAKQKRTDAQLTEVMLANFPKRESKVFQHPASARAKYNGGNYPLEKYEIPTKAGSTKPNLESFAYNEDGEQIPHRSPVNRVAAKPKAEKDKKKGLKVKKAGK